MFFGNRGAAAITGFSARAYMSETPNALRIQAKPLDPTIPAGAQLQLILQLDCVAPFAEPPLLDVNLTYVFISCPADQVDTRAAPSC